MCMMVEWTSQVSGGPSGRVMSSASCPGQLLEANTQPGRQGAHTKHYTLKMLNLNGGPASPEVAALFWGPYDQGGSRRSLATWLHDPASMRPKI